jgi:hypothetical protein
LIKDMLMRASRGRPLALVKLGMLVLPACADGQARDLRVDGGAAESGGDAPAAVADAPAAAADAPAAAGDARVDDASMNATTSCDWGEFNEGALTVVLGVDGASAPDRGVVPCADVPCGFSFTIDGHRLDVPTPTSDLWYPSLLGSGALSTWTVSRLDFHITRGWDVAWSAGQRVDVLNLVRAIECPSVRADQEYPAQAHLSLRDGAGRLLLLSAPDIPLVPNGQALLEATFAPEVTMAWTDLGCPAYQGPGVGPEGGGRRTVGVLVRDAVTGNEAVATWGRNATMQIRGEPYVLSVNQGWVLADGTGCGRAKLTLYRQGYLYRP